MIREQGYTRLVAYDINGTEPIFRCDDREPDDVCTELERLLGWIQDGVRVECGKRGDNVDKGGKPGAGSQRRPMVWRFRPRSEPEREPVAVERVGSAPPSGWISPDVHELKLKVERLQLELDASRPALDESDDNVESDDEPDALDRAKVVVDIVRGIRESVPELFGLFRSTGDRPITGAAASGEIAQDAELMAALDRLRHSDPSQFAQYRDLLLNHYGGQADQ